MTNKLIKDLENVVLKILRRYSTKNTQKDVVLKAHGICIFHIELKEPKKIYFLGCFNNI